MRSLKTVTAQNTCGRKAGAGVFFSSYFPYPPPPFRSTNTRGTLIHTYRYTSDLDHDELGPRPFGKTQPTHMVGYRRGSAYGFSFLRNNNKFIKLLKGNNETINVKYEIASVLFFSSNGYPDGSNESWGSSTTVVLPEITNLFLLLRIKFALKWRCRGN